MRIFASRQCADYACTSYMHTRAGEARVGESVCTTVSKPRWPRRAVVHDQYPESSVSECVRLCDAHMAYTYGMYMHR